MNRRQSIRLLAAAGVGSAFLGNAARSRVAPTGLHLITDRPEADLRRIRVPRDYRVEVLRIAGCRQDLTIVKDGLPVDPVAEVSSVSAGLVELARELRTRDVDGRSLVSIEEPLEEAGYLIIESKGRVVERVDLSRDYRDIHVDGPAGRTTLQVSDGAVRVVRASCRHSNCTRMGDIRSGRIICAPNRLIARVGAGLAAGWRLDAVSG